MACVPAEVRIKGMNKINTSTCKDLKPDYPFGNPYPTQYKREEAKNNRNYFLKWSIMFYTITTLVSFKALSF